MDDESLIALTDIFADATKDFVERKLKPIDEKLASVADAGRVSQLQSEIDKLKQQLSAANKRADAQQRKIDQILAKIATT